MEGGRWRKHFRLLGQEKDDSLMKVLLTDLGRHLGQTPMELYRTYLCETLSLSVAHGSLTDLDGIMLGKFFGNQHRLAEPKYLKIKNAGQIARLGRALNLNLVLVRSPTGGVFTKITDRSIFDLMRSPEKRPETTKIYLLHRTPSVPKTWQLWASNDDVPLHRDGCEAFLQERTTAEDGCLGEQLAELMGVADPDHVHGEDYCFSLMDATGLRGQQLFNRLGRKPFILASHLGAEVTILRSTAPKHQHFGLLEFFRENDEVMKTESSITAVPVFCVTPSGRVYQPYPKYAERIRFPAMPGGRSRHPQSTEFPDLDLTLGSAAKGARMHRAAATASTTKTAGEAYYSFHRGHMV